MLAYILSKIKYLTMSMFIKESIYMLNLIRKSVSDAPRRYIDNTLESIYFLKEMM